MLIVAKKLWFPVKREGKRLLTGGRPEQWTVNDAIAGQLALARAAAWYMPALLFFLWDR